MQQNRQAQQSMLRKPTDEKQRSVLPGLRIAHILNKHGKPFIDGELVKECIEAAASAVCSDENTKKTLASISLSRQTVARRVEVISRDLQCQLRQRIGGFTNFSLALDESTDCSDTAQLAIFIRGIDYDFNVMEGLLAVQSMVGTTTAKDILHEVLTVVEENSLDLSKLSAMITDGAPAMIGSRGRFTSLLKQHLTEKKLPLPITLHCITHQENLAAKSIGMENVLNTVKKVVNYLRTKGLKHRQFKQFLVKVDAEFQDVSYLAEVRWLSKGRMMERSYKLQAEILAFFKSQEKELPEFEDEEFLTDFAFLVDLLPHLNTLNTKLQGQEQLVTDLYKHVAAFQEELGLWEQEMEREQLDEESFPTLCSRSSLVGQDAYYYKYKEVIVNLKAEFERRFVDLHKIRQELATFSAITVPSGDAPVKLKMEIIDLKNDLRLAPLFQPGEDLIKAYRNLPALSYPRIRAFASRLISIYGSTYRCEQLFSRMAFVKNLYRSRLTDDHLADILHISASQLEPNYDTILKSV